jgi:hypothetical protein
MVDLLACSLIVPWDGGTPPALPIGRSQLAAQSRRLRRGAGMAG